MQSRRGFRLALVLATLLASVAIAGGASAAGATGTLRLDPATATVAQGGTFSVKVIANTSVVTSGVAASITFNKAILKVTTITRSPAWANAPAYLAGDAAAIATANQKGVLKGVSVFFFPPTTVPAGDQEFITVGFQAIGCGTVAMTLPIGKTNSDSTLLDGRAATYGSAIKLTTSGATVNVCSGVAGASGSPGASSSGGPGDSSSPAASDSFDPNASTSPSPGAGDSSDPGASIPAPSASAPATDNASSSSSEQSGWLTFAIAALAVAAAGLATLILVLVVVAIVAAVIGGNVLIRAWRRNPDAGRSPDAGATAQPAPDAAPTAEPGPGAQPTAAPEVPADGGPVGPTTGPGPSDAPAAEPASTPTPSNERPPAAPDRAGE